MAIKSTRVTLRANTPIQLSVNDHATGLDDATVGVLLKMVTAGATIYVGDSTVTDPTGASPGFPWDTADGSLSFQLEPGEDVWGVTAASTADQTIAVLRQGR